VCCGEALSRGREVRVADNHAAYIALSARAFELGSKTDAHGRSVTDRSSTNLPRDLGVCTTTPPYAEPAIWPRRGNGGAAFSLGDIRGI
jgi:hypothetical protein